MKKMLVLIILVGLVSCKEEVEKKAVSSAQTASVDMSLGSYTVAKAGPLDFLMPSAYAAITDLKVCFKRLRFKRDLEDTVDPLLEDNVDISLGEVSLTGAPIDLGQYTIPVGLYKRIEFDLEKDCVEGITSNSVTISNDFGNHSTVERITIKFDGSFDLTTNTSLQLGVQNIVDAINAYDGVGSVKDTLEGVSGEL